MIEISKSYHKTVKQLNLDMLTNKEITIVTYGDSWTYGSTATGYPTASGDPYKITGSWSMQLKRYVETRNKNAVLYNEGVGGWNSLEGDNNFSAKVLSHIPNYLLLNFGINDSRNEVGINDYINNMESMISTAKSNDCEVILWVSGPLSIKSNSHDYGYTQFNDDSHIYKFIEYIESLHQLAIDNDLLIINCRKMIDDYWLQGTNIASWYSDHLHFNQPGHNVIFNTIKKEVFPLRIL